MSDERKPTVEEVMRLPIKGDLLCYDGRAWQVGRRDGRYYEVPDPEKPIVNAERTI